MKLLIFTNYFPPEMGAASNRIFYLANGLKMLGHDVEIVAPLPNYPEGEIFDDYKRKFSRIEKIQGIIVNRYWIYATISKKPVQRALGMVSFAASFWVGLFRFRKKKPDVVIIQHSPLFVSFSALVLSRFFKGCKKVLNVSDLWPLSALELGVMQEGKMFSLLEKIENYNYLHSDLIMGQSNEILTHVSSRCNKSVFLYRNIGPNEENDSKNTFKFEGVKKIIYAGLLGVAQGVYQICKNVDFKTLGVEFHIYGGGNEEALIKEYLMTNKDSNIFFHGSLRKSELHKVLPRFHASIVPLASRIYGAVPSKIYELIALSVPVLFCGGGEGAQIISENEVGFTSDPGNFEQLSNNIIKLKELNDEAYGKLLENCMKMANSQLNFQNQIEQFNCELKILKSK